MSIRIAIEFADKKEVSFIEVDSFSFGVENTSTLGGSSTGAGGGKAVFQEFTVTKSQDQAASPLLFASCVGGELLPAVQVQFFPTGSTSPYLSYELKEVLISTIQWSSGGDRPTESVSFAFETLEVEYFETTGNTTDTFKTGGSFFYPGALAG
jgi:type VI secretion system secreted protein Hcp